MIIVVVVVELLVMHVYQGSIGKTCNSRGIRRAIAPACNNSQKIRF